MQFEPLPLPGAFVVAPERHSDARGYFARTFCSDEFAAHGLAGSFVQCSTSFNVRRGTLRGMHYQRPPYEEVKLVRCTRGVVLDVLLHRESGCWHAVELSEQNGLGCVYTGGVCPWVPDAAGELRSVLSDGGAASPGGRGGDPMGRSGLCDCLADQAANPVGTGCGP